MFCIRIADLNIEINNQYEYVEKMCRDYIVGADTYTSADMYIEVTDEDIEKEKGESEAAFSSGYCESICIYREISMRLIDYDAFLVHGACIQYEDDAYIFLAKSGTGKSTHIRLWKKVYKDAVRVINGDKPIIRFCDGRFMIYGTPWCGKEGWNTNTRAPLKALCFIERGQDNTIEVMEDSDVMSRLCHQILMPKDKSKLIKYLDMMDKLIRETDSYVLHCNMDEDAAKVACEGMN